MSKYVRCYEGSAFSQNMKVYFNLLCFNILIFSLFMIIMSVAIYSLSLILSSNVIMVIGFLRFACPWWP